MVIVLFRFFKINFTTRLCWLFRASTVTFPSIYLTENWGSAEERRIRVRGIINEAFRVQKSCGIQKPILAYSRYRYSDTEKFYKIVSWIQLLV